MSVSQAASTANAESLQAVTDAGGAQTAIVMVRVEERMATLASEYGATLSRHARETISAGGKRLRPLLVCIASGVPVVQSDPLVRAAIAVEFVHAATLVHDDVIDRADLRRGRPTVVVTGGRLIALATGDLLFSRAFAELAGGGQIEPIRLLAQAAGSLAEGELMQRGDAWDVNVPRGRYLERCRLKTGVLFRAACELGALAGGGDVESLGRFGERIGIAFQLLDDVLDVTGPPERTGKPRGADLLDGTVTLPLIEARGRDSSLGELDLRTLRTADQAAALCDRIEASGALHVARDHALGVVAEAKASLPATISPAQRAALELVADGVVERYA